MFRVFVYGTLLRGFGNWSWALANRATFVQEDALKGFTMLDLGPYPGIIDGGDANAVVKGELFSFDDEDILRDLDRLEGHPSFYQRTPVVLESGEAAEVYVLNRQWRDSDHVQALESGDWRAHTGKQYTEKQEGVTA